MLRKIIPSQKVYVLKMRRGKFVIFNAINWFGYGRNFNEAYSKI